MKSQCNRTKSNWKRGQANEVESQDSYDQNKFSVTHISFNINVIERNRYFTFDEMSYPLLCRIDTVSIGQFCCVTLIRMLYASSFHIHFGILLLLLRLRFGYCCCSNSAWNDVKCLLKCLLFQFTCFGRERKRDNESQSNWSWEWKGSVYVCVCDANKLYSWGHEEIIL